MPAIQYFQAVATAIPTLLIALAVGMRLGETTAARLEAVPVKHLTRFTIILATNTLIIVAGEFAALFALVRGGGNGVEAIICFLAVVVCLNNLIVFLLLPILKRYPAGVMEALFGAVAVIFEISAVVLFALLLIF